MIENQPNSKIFNVPPFSSLSLSRLVFDKFLNSYSQTKSRWARDFSSFFSTTWHTTSFNDINAKGEKKMVNETKEDVNCKKKIRFTSYSNKKLTLENEILLQHFQTRSFLFLAFPFVLLFSSFGFLLSFFSFEITYHLQFKS